MLAKKRIRQIHRVTAASLGITFQYHVAAEPGPVGARERGHARAHRMMVTLQTAGRVQDLAEFNRSPADFITEIGQQ
jgi:hypothetical protein